MRLIFDVKASDLPYIKDACEFLIYENLLDINGMKSVYESLGFPVKDCQKIPQQPVNLTHNELSDTDGTLQG